MISFHRLRRLCQRRTLQTRIAAERDVLRVMDLIQHIDLQGQTVLDVGATDGLASFGMAKLGAKVHATDSVDKPTFRRAGEVLGPDVDYHPKTQIKDFAKIFSSGTFDLIFCASAFYHMLNPASSVFECRKLLKDGGLLLMETPYYPGEDRAAIFINSETETVNETYTYLVPTKSAVSGLMKLAGFEILAIRTISPTRRITVLGRAVSPDQVSERSPLLTRIHDADFCDHEFRFKDEPRKDRSFISYRGPRDALDIKISEYEPDFPYQPPRERRLAGSTIWSTPGGNR